MAIPKPISALLFDKETAIYRIPKFATKMGAWLQNHIPFMPKTFIQPWMIDLADDHYALDITRARKLLGGNQSTHWMIRCRS